MQKAVLVLIVAGAVVLTGCGTKGTAKPMSQADRLTSTACKDIVGTMTPKNGSNAIQLGMPFQRLIMAVDEAHNEQLRSELAAFQAAAATGGDFLKYSSELLRTCSRLGFGGATR